MREDIQKTPEEVFAIYHQEMYELSSGAYDWNSYRRHLACSIRKGTPGLILAIGRSLGFFVECCHKFGLPCIGLGGCSFAVEIPRNALKESFRVLRNGGNSTSVFNREKEQDHTHINLHFPSSIKRELIRVRFSQVKHLNSPLKFRGGKGNPLNRLLRAFFTLFPLTFLSASGSCIATQISTEEP